MDVSRMELDLDNRRHILCSSPFNWLYDPGLLHFQYCRNALPGQSFGLVLAHCGHCWVLWACPLLVVLWILSRTDGEVPIEFANQKARRVRFASFKSILRQNAAFFDREEHSTGSLTNMLGSDATAMANFIGLSLGAILTATVGIVSGTILAFLKAPFMSNVKSCLWMETQSCCFLLCSSSHHWRLLCFASAISPSRYYSWSIPEVYQTHMWASRLYSHNCSITTRGRRL